MASRLTEKDEQGNWRLKGALWKLKDYEDTGLSPDEVQAIEKLEKKVPKKPVTYEETNRADCPACGATVRGIAKPFGDFCSKCDKD